MTLQLQVYKPFLYALGPTVYRWELLWASWTSRVRFPGYASRLDQGSPQMSSGCFFPGLQPGIVCVWLSVWGETSSSVEIAASEGFGSNSCVHHCRTNFSKCHGKPPGQPQATFGIMVPTVPRHGSIYCKFQGSGSPDSLYLLGLMLGRVPSY